MVTVDVPDVDTVDVRVVDTVVDTVDVASVEAVLDNVDVAVVVTVVMEQPCKDPANCASTA